MGIHQISKYNYEFIIADDVSGSSEVDSSWKVGKESLS